ncbi:hypothetical protein H0X32_02865 [Patescibacteria group bacterium]|nr:hypothetical protein [Patescibacteria group bacterium]
MTSSVPLTGASSYAAANAIPTSPLDPIQTPFSTIFTTINEGQVLAITFALIFIVWLIYTLVVTYHWLKYGHRSWVAVPALSIHLVVSALLFLLAISGFVFQ